jgi:hypothetical protein
VLNQKVACIGGNTQSVYFLVFHWNRFIRALGEKEGDTMATGLAFVHLNFFAHIEVMLLTHLVEMIDQSSARMVEIIDCLMLRLCLQCVTAQGISFRSLYWTSPESGGTYIL